MSDKPFYLTTTLPYVNADPHIGFALEIVHADIIARYQRLQGREVFFNTGTDEHGQKIFQRAAEEKKEVQEYVDHYAEKFRKLKSILGLSDEIVFIRTTDQKHIDAAQEIWKRCYDAGDIEKRKYKGLYCVGDEMFLKDSDLVEGKCPNHPNMVPVEIEEENYFFLLSKYQEQLEKYLSQPGVIVPEWRREEALAFVRGGLEDFSISREIARMSWGIPVPGDDTQVMYVWFDALTNYISTLDWPDGDNFKKFWSEGEVVQMAGKDQVRFQSVMWQAMLISAQVKNTDKVVYHGFITSGGQKMSKSLGNVIDPVSIVKEYGTDALRFFLARHVHPFDDSDFTMERFKEAYNADLANGIGNLVARIMKMSSEHLSEVPEISDLKDISEWKAISKHLEDFEFNRAFIVISTRISTIDSLIQEGKPFELIKTNKIAAEKQIRQLVRELAIVALSLQPFLPNTSQKILDSIRENKKPENLFPRKE